MQKEAHLPCETVIFRKSLGPLRTLLFYSSCNSEAPPGLESGSESEPFETLFLALGHLFLCGNHSGRHFPCAGTVNPHLYQKGVIIIQQTTFAPDKAKKGAGRKSFALEKTSVLEKLCF